MWATITDQNTGETHYDGPIARMETRDDGRLYVAYDANTCQYLDGARYRVAIADRAPTTRPASLVPPDTSTIGARCIRCGDIGADAELGNVCLECDYDTEGEYDAPTDHAGTVITARARVECLDDGNTGTVVHTGNVVDDGTVRVSITTGDGAPTGTRDYAPNRLNVIEPTRPEWIYGQDGRAYRATTQGTDIPDTDTGEHTASRANPAPGALGDAMGWNGLAPAAVRARLDRSDIGRA